eukprot:TRINITY_DN284_c2_g1_i2.p1 TRINITY_DN284_c2_g1~~TRINITY_DN284_c2_g1_i2.p1  ORF type:complete len:1139 (-),score=310.24 TRINITY_DN284_c2_g1_i2:66-3368(-)
MRKLPPPHAKPRTAVHSVPVGVATTTFASLPVPVKRALPAAGATPSAAAAHPMHVPAGAAPQPQPQPQPATPPVMAAPKPPTVAAPATAPPVVAAPKPPTTATALHVTEHALAAPPKSPSTTAEPPPAPQSATAAPYTPPAVVAVPLRPPTPIEDDLDSFTSPAPAPAEEPVAPSPASPASASPSSVPASPATVPSPVSAAASDFSPVLLPAPASPASPSAPSTSGFGAAAVRKGGAAPRMNMGQRRQAQSAALAEDAADAKAATTTPPPDTADAKTACSSVSTPPMKRLTLDPTAGGQRQTNHLTPRHGFASWGGQQPAAAGAAARNEVPLKQPSVPLSACSIAELNQEYDTQLAIFLALRDFFIKFNENLSQFYSGPPEVEKCHSPDLCKLLTNYTSNCCNIAHLEHLNSCLRKVLWFFFTMGTSQSKMVTVMAELIQNLAQAHNLIEIQLIGIPRIQESRAALEEAQSKYQQQSSKDMNHQAQKRNKVDLVKLAELQSERDALQGDYKAEIEAAVLDNDATLAQISGMSLSAVSQFVDAAVDSFKAGLSAAETMQAEARTWTSVVRQLSLSAGVAAGAVDVSGAGGNSHGSTVLSLAQFVADEQAYLKVLKSIAQAQTTVMTDGSLFTELTKDDVTGIFSNIDQMLQLHEQFILPDALRSTSLIDFFPPKMATFLDVYTKYVNNYVNSQQTLSACSKKSKAFAAVLKTFSDKPQIGELTSILGMPIKRVFDYFSYFNDTQATNASELIVLQCTEKLRRLCELAEAAKYSHQTDSIAKSIVGWAEATHQQPLQRRYVTKADCSTKDQGKICVVIFSDVVVFTKKGALKSKLQYLSSINMQSGVTVSAVADISSSMRFCVQLESQNPAVTVVLSLDSEEEQKHLLTQLSMLLQQQQQKKIFGVALSALMATGREKGRDVPSIVEETVRALEQMALDEEGIFRLSASSKVIDAVHKQLDCGDVNVSFEGMNCHVVAGIFKLFIRSLPEPLLTFALYQQFKTIAETEDEQKRVAIAKSLVTTQLPKYNAYTLQRICRLFWLVSNNSEVNKMGARNLSVVFAPHLMRADSGSEWSMMEDSSVFTVVQCLIEDYPAIFEVLFD